MPATGLVPVNVRFGYLADPLTNISLMAAFAGKADPLATRIKLSQRECLLSPKAAVKIDSKWVKLGSAFGSQADVTVPQVQSICTNTGFA